MHFTNALKRGLAKISIKISSWALESLGKHLTTDQMLSPLYKAPFSPHCCHSVAATSHQVLLPCLIGEGMFSTEYAIEIKLGDDSFSLFADSSLVKKEHGENYLLVTLIGDNGEPDHKTV